MSNSEFGDSGDTSSDFVDVNLHDSNLTPNLSSNTTNPTTITPANANFDDKHDVEQLQRQVSRDTDNVVNAINTAIDNYVSSEVMKESEDFSNSQSQNTDFGDSEETSRDENEMASSSVHIGDNTTGTYTNQSLDDVNFVGIHDKIGLRILC